MYLIIVDQAIPNGHSRDQEQVDLAHSSGCNHRVNGVLFYAYHGDRNVLLSIDMPGPGGPGGGGGFGVILPRVVG